MTPSPTTNAKPRDLERRLVTYAVTAGAAFLTATQDAAAAPITRIVELDIPADVGPVPLDVDDNGVDDFLFQNLSGAPYGYLTATGNLANGFLGIPYIEGEQKNLGLALPKGSYQWGPTGDLPDVFVNQGILGGADSQEGGLLLPVAGKLPTSNYYPLPLVFDINGATHYGWARIRAEFVAPYTLSASILDVGWESEPDTDIHIPDPIPEPGSLGLLAIGAAGLALRRRLTRSKVE